MRASRVSGERHERWKMIPVAQIVPRTALAPPSELALARHCRERLAGYKVPVRFQIVQALPQTPSGTIKR